MAVGAGPPSGCAATQCGGLPLVLAVDCTTIPRMEPIIAIRDLTRRYGALTAVDAVSLSVQPGEIVALLGPNGAGKTTTIRLLMGQLMPHAGSAAICGIDCFEQRSEAMRHTGYLPDEPVYHDHLSGAELCRFVGRMHGLDANAIERRTMRWAERFGLVDELNEFAMNYSLGMRKKLGLILALLPQPRLLMLDEPASGLDPFATRVLHDTLRAFAAEGGAVLHSTHLLDQAERLCTRVAIIARGRLVADGSLEQLRQAAGADADLEQVFFALAGEGAAAMDPAP